jgi:hypothetical protein
MPRKVSPRLGSDSLTQRQAEAVVLKLFGDARGLDLKPGHRLTFQGRRFTVDGFAERGDEIFLVEVWSRVGEAKAAQKHKVRADILKLATLTRLFQQQRPAARVECSIVFVDELAAQALSNTTWASLSAELFRIRTEVIAISDELRQAILAAQRTQDLRYVPDEGELAASDE